MKFEWEEIYSNGSCDESYFEATYRSKVFGGWLIRHETFNDYQYGCSEKCEGPSSNHRHIEEEGYHNNLNVITFISDPKHEWEIEK